jgi:integrase
MTPNNEFRFTKKMIDGISPSPAGKRLEYRDTEVKGLCLRVTDRGGKTFSVHKRVKNGALQRITIGSHPAVSVEQARKIALEHLSMLATGMSVADKRRRKRLEMTFGDLFGAYYAHHSKPNKRSSDDDMRHYQMHIKKCLDLKKLSEIERIDVANMHAQITLTAKIAANRVLALVSSVFGWGIKRGYCEKNPASHIQRNREESRSRFILPSEMPYFLEAVGMEENKLLADFVLIALFTGARRQNVLSMQWSDIDFDGALWRLERTKNGHPQQVILSQPAIEILRRRKTDSNFGYVFNSKGKTGHLVEPKRGWERILKRASCLKALTQLSANSLLEPALYESLKNAISDNFNHAYNHTSDVALMNGMSKVEWSMEDLWIHDLRRTYGSWQVMNNSSLVVIGKSLNHKSVASTNVYARVETETIRSSVEQATQAMVARYSPTPIGTNQLYH